MCKNLNSLNEPFRDGTAALGTAALGTAALGTAALGSAPTNDAIGGCHARRVRCTAY